MRRTILRVLLCLSASTLIHGCTPSKSGTQISVRATGLSASMGGAVSTQSHGTKLGPQSVTNPVAASGEYIGMGTNSGDSVVESLKVKLTGISTQTGAPGDRTSNQSTASLFDWRDSPRELEIKDGFNSAIEDSTTVTFAQGDYLFMSVSMLNAYDLMAYAYLDADADGTIDTTIYTTAEAVTKVSSVVSPATLHGDASLKYGYHHYGFLDAGSSDSVTNSTSSANVFTAFAQPIKICDGQPEENVGPDGGASGCKAPPNLRVDLLVDTTRLIKAWDGRFGDRGSSARIPPPISPFPNDPHPTNGKNRYDLGSTDFFPGGTPAFGFGTYLPMFSFITPDATGKRGMTAQTYAVSMKDPAGATFKYDETYRLTVVFDDTGVPQIGQAAANTPEAAFFLGAAARMFEKAGDGYAFYTSGSEVDPATGVVDGGLYYHNDPSMAGHKVVGLAKLASVGDTVVVKEYDGPRCDSRAQEVTMHQQMNNVLSDYDAYDHCLAFLYDKATSANDAATLATLTKEPSGAVYRTLYLARLK